MNDMRFNIEGNILDYIDKEELKDAIKHQVKNEIYNILSDNKEIKKIVIQQVIDDIKDIQLTEEIKIALKDKVTEIIKEEYLNNNWQIKYDIGLAQKVKELYEVNKETFDPIIYEALSKTINEYKPDNYEISKIGVDLILADENAINRLKDVFIERIDEILEKI